MNDPCRMRGIQGIGELRAQFQDVVAFEPPLSQKPGLERFSFDRFHDDEGLTVVFADFMNRADVGMIQRGGSARLPFESRNSDGSWPNPSGRTLIATSRPSFLSLARYTSPMPPFPRTERTS